MKETKFSVLMCVCNQDNIDNFYVALKSVALEQDLSPNEIVIVVDGLVDSSVDDIIQDISEKNNIHYQIIKNEKQKGLAYSLNKGLNYCSHEWVARMDADDISLPYRFSRQMRFISSNPSIAVLGSAVFEFGNVDRERVKKAITDSSSIKKTIRYRNPMNHPSCIFNRKKVLSVGGYPMLKKNQDYGLWVLLIAKGYELANLEDVLLKFRLSKNFYNKRGIRLLKYDFAVLLLMMRSGLTFPVMFIFILIGRVIIRSLPSYLLKLIYSFSRK